MNEHSLCCTVLLQSLQHSLTWAELERHLTQVQSSFEQQEITQEEAEECAYAAWGRSKEIPEGEDAWSF